MRKQKIGDSEANNFKTAEDGAKVTAGIKYINDSSFFLQKLVIVS